jgi:hypothetical protein
MKTNVLLSKPLFVPLALAISTLLGMGIITLVVQAAEDAKRIEIVIKDKTATVSGGYTDTGIPTEIVVRNEDTITHGFNSSLFTPDMKVEMSGGALAQEMGPHVYRVDPGRTMVLKFTPLRQPEGSMSFAFWCDKHHSVKGEMLVVELSGPGGA